MRHEKGRSLEQMVDEEWDRPPSSDQPKRKRVRRAQRAAEAQQKITMANLQKD